MVDGVNLKCARHVRLTLAGLEALGRCKSQATGEALRAAPRTRRTTTNYHPPTTNQTSAWNIPTRLYAVCDAEACARAGWKAVDFAVACLDGGARLLQLRAKSLASGEFLRLLDTLVSAASARDAAVIVNDRVDLARLSGAAGVHVGQEDLPARAAREQLGDEAVIGLSTHTSVQIDSAAREPVSYIAVGPVFGTTTKNTGYDAVGVDLVTQARRRVPAHVPIVAIGGMTLERADEAIRAGASAVAVIGDLLTEDPAARVALYLERLAAAGKV